MKNSKAITEVNTERLNKLLELSEALLSGDFSKRLVTDVKDDIVNQIITNINQHADKLMLSLPNERGDSKISVSYIIDVITAFANHDFHHKLPVSSHGTILDAIATGINLLGEELEQSTASKQELEIERNRLNEAQAIAKVGSCELNLLTFELTGSREFDRIFELGGIASNKRFEVYRKKYHPKDLNKLDKAIDRIKTKGQGFNFEHRIMPNNGFVKHISYIGEPIRSNSGQITGIKGTVQDITERKNTEIELNDSFRIVTDQNKRLLNFSYIVSHNLRSHAGNIKSLLTLLETIDSEEEKEEIMKHLKTVSNLLNDTMVNLHDIVSIQKSVDLIIEPLNLHAYLERAIDVLGEQITLKKAIVKNNVSTEKVINYNPAYLESIILNFISNSIKYSHSERQPLIQIDFFEENGRAILQFTDNGIGIDMQKYGDKLFGMYKTFHGNQDARGIGLFISKNQIEAMGGKVEVESIVNKGTTFKIYLK